MKRILFILAIALMVGGCSYPEGTIPTAGRMIPNVPVIQTFEHDGHEYVLAWSANGVSVVHSASCPCHHQAAQTLSEWELLQLAIVYTESKFRPEVTGKNQDGGCYQMTPIYVREVNRIAGTDYAHEDVYDPDKAIEIFGKMQDAKNPGHDIDTAIYFHNKSASYKRVVLENLELIKRYETFRAKLIEKQEKNY